MCPHGIPVEAGAFCPQCPGPRMKQSRGSNQAVATCPRCSTWEAFPSFATDENGYTVTTLTCVLCGHSWEM